MLKGNLRLHLPILPMSFANTPMDVAVIFRPQPGKLGVLYGAKVATAGSLTAEGSPLGAAVDEGIFPLTLPYLSGR